MAELIRDVETWLDAKTGGLPEEFFLFLSRITPLINVDLLIQDDSGCTLLTWRSDEFYGPGWHVPGGIIRFKETAVDRIRIVAKRELGVAVEFGATPILVRESIVPDRWSVDIPFLCSTSADWRAFSIRVGDIRQMRRCRINGYGTRAAPKVYFANSDPMLRSWDEHASHPPAQAFRVDQ